MTLQFSRNVESSAKVRGTIGPRSRRSSGLYDVGITSRFNLSDFYGAIHRRINIPARSRDALGRSTPSKRYKGVAGAPRYVELYARPKNCPVNPVSQKNQILTTAGDHAPRKIFLFTLERPTCKRSKILINQAA